MEELLDELVRLQQQKILAYGRKIIPFLTADDILQPNDFPKLENNPYFRYEEGVLEGLLTARMAYFAKQSDLACSLLQK